MHICKSIVHTVIHMHVAVLKPSHKILPSCVLLNQHVTYACRLNNETTLSTSATYIMCIHISIFNA